ncbi:solute carrier family 35 member B1-like [Tubulanus polymorphus]|uniref:solute carrier family 35 member B1-like n=1 Tax=Tubulanus polymorphus TaxID=672921 RepID=UPI003DA54EC2
MNPETKVTIVGDEFAGESSSKTMQNDRKKLIVCFLGVFLCYFYYGILQEKITKGKYLNGEKPERFTFTITLVFIQCIINSIFAKCVLLVSSKPETRDSTPIKMFAACAVTYLTAMLASNQALQFINYPTQVLGKSVKPIPVMILGVLLARKRYPLQKYLFVLSIVVGVALFIYKDKPAAEKQGPSAGAEHSSGLPLGMGELLLILSLTMDGLTGAIQDKARSLYSVQPHNMMLHMNLWSVLFLGILSLVTGEMFPFLAFVNRHPFVLVNMLTFSLASALGQNFIFITVSSFGPLMCSIVTTTRKFFTILASIVLFNHAMSSRQWIGTGFVFFGLIMDNLYGKERKLATKK